MMNTQLTPQDIEQLSAYLDQELEAGESARLEVRLINEPELNAALRDLRRTRLVLRSLPIVRAPRNFTISPNTAGIRQREGIWLRWFSTLRLSSALAGILLVFVLLGDFLTGLTPLPAMLSQTTANTQVEEASEPAAAAEAFLAPESPAEDSGSLQAEGEMRIQVVPQLELKTPVGDTPAPTPMELLTIPEVITETEQGGQPIPQQPPFRGLGGGGGGGGAEGIQPPQEPLIPRSDALLVVRTIEIFLAIIAGSAAMAAWSLYRRRA